MSQTPRFSLRFIKQENHLMLPEVTSILVTQKLYDILFQYVITSEKEKKLENFIKILEQYIKSKPIGPFSLPVRELEFLEEGLQELKLLNWREIPVTLFEIILEEPSEEEEKNTEQLDSVLSLLAGLMPFNRSTTTGQIYVYPTGLTGF
ncbi:MAG TPA: hypothetical protein DD811_01175 [Syntrophomonas sp.]|jgi:hypothetical protein|nr:hypothetical protein [Syntrophomonas sp.]